MSSNGSGNVLDPDAPLKIAYLTYRGKPHVGGQGVYTRHLTKALADLGPHRRGVRRPAVSGARRPGRAHRAAEPRHCSTTTTPAVCRATGRSRTATTSWRSAQFSPGSSPSRSRSRPARPMHCRTARGEFDLVHDNQCLGYGILKIEEQIPTIVTLHHPITKDRKLEMSHARNRVQTLVGRPLVRLRQDAGQGRVEDAAHRRRQPELDPGHPRRHGRPAGPDAARARRRRPRPVHSRSTTSSATRAA